MAAGQGSRMRSAQPKVLHTLAGAPLLQHVLATATALQPRNLVVVVGHQGEQVQAYLSQCAPQAQSVWQRPPQGTGHAVQQAVPQLANDGVVLVLSGDVPLIDLGNLQALCALAQQGALALLSLNMPEPTGYGRIVRKEQAVVGIVEEKDATDAQRQLTEVYTGVLAAPAAELKRWLARLSNHNAQGEYYLTDVVAYAVADGCTVDTVAAAHANSVAGVNTPLQLAQLERALQQQRAQALLQQGVQLADPARVDVRGNLQCGQDVRIDINCIFEGNVVLAEGVQVGAHCVLRHATVGPGTQLLPHTLIEGDAQQPVV
ncbi:MAG: NTP transferase domain-containing protein, partial [Burkholderiaceae bacterium]